MFVYCMDVLHLSEAEAYLRLTAARAARAHPVLLQMLADGRLHLTGIAKLAPHLTPENRDLLLARAVHRSKRQIEELVAELAPRPDVPGVLRKLPSRPIPSNQKERPALPFYPFRTQSCPLQISLPRIPCSSPSDALRLLPPSGPVPPPVPPPPVLFSPLAPDRYKVQFTAGAELRDKLPAPSGSPALGGAGRRPRRDLRDGRRREARATGGPTIRSDELSSEEPGPGLRTECPGPVLPAHPGCGSTCRPSARRRSMLLRGRPRPEMLRAPPPRVSPPASFRARRGPRSGQHLPDVPHPQPVPRRGRLRDEGARSALGTGSGGGAIDWNSPGKQFGGTSSGASAQGSPMKKGRTVAGLLTILVRDRPLSPSGLRLVVQHQVAARGRRARSPGTGAGSGAVLGGCCHIEYEDVDEGRAREDERHHVERGAARAEGPDDAHGAERAQRPAQVAAATPGAREALELALSAQSAPTGTSTPIRK